LPVRQRLSFPTVQRLALAAAGCLAPGVAQAQDDNAELAKKLSNPVASLISVPLQQNYDCCYGPEDGGRYTLNVQPVIPLSLSQDWNLIIRTIVPIVKQERAYPGQDSAFGLSDTTQSFFFSPKATHDGLTWAIGPAVLWPTGDSDLGTRKWGAGPTGLLLKQQDGFTYGVLANHIWSWGGGESSYNWKTKGWTVPVNLSVSHLYKFGDQRVSLGAGVKGYAAQDGEGPEWGLRLIATFLFPK
jgi:hypothetical protein